MQELQLHRVVALVVLARPRARREAQRPFVGDVYLGRLDVWEVNGEEEAVLALRPQHRRGADLTAGHVRRVQPVGV